MAFLSYPVAELFIWSEVRRKNPKCITHGGLLQSNLLPFKELVAYFPSLMHLLG